MFPVRLCGVLLGVLAAASVAGGRQCVGLSDSGTSSTGKPAFNMHGHACMHGGWFLPILVLALTPRSGTRTFHVLLFYQHFGSMARRGSAGMPRAMATSFASTLHHPPSGEIKLITRSLSWLQGAASAPFPSPPGSTHSLQPLRVYIRA